MLQHGYENWQRQTLQQRRSDDFANILRLSWGFETVNSGHEHVAEGAWLSPFSRQFASVRKIQMRSLEVVVFWSHQSVVPARTQGPKLHHLVELGPSSGGKGQIIATSHDLTPKGSWERELPLFQGNLGWWNIIIWPDDCSSICYVYTRWFKPWPNFIPDRWRSLI